LAASAIHATTPPEPSPSFSRPQFRYRHADHRRIRPWSLRHYRHAAPHAGGTAELHAGNHRLGHVSARRRQRRYQDDRWAPHQSLPAATFSAALPNWLQASGLVAQDPRVWALLGQTLFSQAEMIGFLDVFQWITILFFCLLPLTLLIPRRVLPTG